MAQKYKTSSKNKSHTSRGKYTKTSPKKSSPTPETQVGIYTQWKGNFWFVDTIDETSWEKKWYYVYQNNRGEAFPWDTVYFYTKTYRGKQEAVITWVKERSDTLIIGRLQIQKWFGFVVPESQYLPADIYIPGKFLKWYSEWQRVGVQIINWNKKNPEGRIREILPEKNEKWGMILSIAAEWWARITFPQKVIDEANTWSWDIDPQEKQQRVDMTDMLTFTIDGADSKDLDDAISITPLYTDTQQTGWKLYVHIADVTHYVPEKSDIDREAFKRGTSIYMVNKVIPMLPEVLSNNHCSLHPGEQKRTLTCEIDVNLSWHMIDSQVYTSIIDSDYRLTYAEVQEILDSSPEDADWYALHFWGTASPELVENIQQISQLKQALETYKDSQWMLHFDFPETKIEVDANDMPVRFYEYERYDSHRIIEQCMILANEAIAYQFHKIPFLYRIHETPDEDDVETYLKLLKKFDIDVEIPDISPKSFQKILNAIQGTPRWPALERLLLRTLKKAIYSEKNLWHFWLASKYYSHFTSPIRRYPDLQIHRIIKETLTWNQSQNTPSLKQNRKKHYQEILPKVAIQSSEREVKSEKIEYRVRDYMSVEYMKNKIWQRFEGNISGIIEKWFFVELPNTIEWFVSFWLSWLSYDADEISMFSPESGREYTFGDSVTVELISVDEENFRIDFELIE